jgi:uracil-DNA glycosylase
LNVKIEKSWLDLLESEFNSSYFKELTEFVRSEYKQYTVYPAAKNIFRAFDQVPVDRVRVVILGQDPYHGAGQAHGLCFSVESGIPLPPSLLNIYKEIVSEMGGSIPQSGDLTHWAEQGVLLLNATLTVRSGEAGSHQNKGWEVFTDSVIQKLSLEKKGLIFFLWGAYAIKKSEWINKKDHLVLTSPHPSPLSAYRGFFGNGHFKKANEYLISKGEKPIQWI